MKTSRKGQSTIEYLVFFMAVIVVLIFFVAQAGSPYKTRLNQTYEWGTNTLESTSNAFFNSF